MSQNLLDLQQWYASMCDGGWEHEFGPKIDTLDNPGWSINFDLNGLSRAIEIQDVTENRSELDWILVRSSDQMLRISCGATNLDEAVGLFVSLVRQAEA